jgi:hypothetical protein
MNDFFLKGLRPLDPVFLKRLCDGGALAATNTNDADTSAWHNDQTIQKKEASL